MEKHETASFCPACGEPVKVEWKICPACETRLGGLACPGCGRAVKDNWKRCPECEAPLICPDCGGRITSAGCPVCSVGSGTIPESSPVFNEKATGMTLIRVPGGSFRMGDTFGAGIENELPVHEVELDEFYIGQYPVIQSEWSALMSENPSRFRGERLPVEQVGWAEAAAFIAKLNAAQAGERKFMLPSEAQWEYAARSGGKEALYAGGDDIDAVAWYEENSRGRTQPVGGRAPNRLGIYDMSGNVWEWCRDVYREDAYRFHPRLNPVCIQDGTDRVIRGGGWNLDAWSARCSRRFSYPVDFCGPSLGFRLVMIPVRN